MGSSGNDASKPYVEGSLRVSLWGDNLTDDDYSKSGINFGGLAIITESYGAPRTWGLELAHEF